MSRRVVVVGGGLAGLAAAGWLARAGLAVTVLERASAPGGRARTRLVEGALLNLGPHALYRGGEAASALRDLGVSWRGRRPPSRGVVRRQGALHALPGGPISLFGTSLWGTSGALEAARFLGGLPWADAGPWHDAPAARWLEGARDPGLRDLLAGLLRVSTYANAPEALSAGMGLEQLRLALTAGVDYLDGGWQSLVDALAGTAEGLGARVVCGARAAGLRRSGERVTGVLMEDGEALPADAVVLAVAPEVAAALLERPALHDAVPARAACLDLVLDGLPLPAQRFAVDLDAPHYLAAHSGVAALGEGVVVHAARYLAPGERVARELLEGWVDAVQPGWRARVRHARFLPELVVAHALPRPGAPGTGRAPVDAGGGVWLAGDWVGSRGMLLDAALASAREAAAGILAVPVREAA